MCTNNIRKVKGYIFRQHCGRYHHYSGEGCTRLKEEAYVFSCKDASYHMSGGYAPKSKGKWLVVYE